MVITRTRKSGGVAAVVVLYRPTEASIDNMSLALAQVDILFAVDNTELPDPGFMRSLRRRRRVVYVWNGENAGIARALNIGAQLALRRRCQYLLTLDQDSSVEPRMVRQLVEFAEQNPRVGVIAPFHLDRNAPEPVPPIAHEDLTTVMSSGSLLRLSAYEHIGGFLDGLFIDYVDDEFCLRLRANGWRVVRVNGAILQHALGRMTKKHLFSRIVRVTHHPPERYYYQTRNRMILRSAYPNQFPDYFREERVRQLGRLAKMILYESDRWAKVVMVIRGLLAGWKKQEGPRSLPVSRH